jgi:hypothetical protein
VAAYRKLQPSDAALLALFGEWVAEQDVQEKCWLATRRMSTDFEVQEVWFIGTGSPWNKWCWARKAVPGVRSSAILKRRDAAPVKAWQQAGLAAR